MAVREEILRTVERLDRAEPLDLAYCHAVQVTPVHAGELSSAPPSVRRYR